MKYPIGEILHRIVPTPWGQEGFMMTLPPGPNGKLVIQAVQSFGKELWWIPGSEMLRLSEEALHEHEWWERKPWER